MPSDRGRRRSVLTGEQERKRASLPRRYRGLYERAVIGSRRDAVRVHCLECVGWAFQEVPLCSDPGCALYPYRMGSPDLPEGD